MTLQNAQAVVSVRQEYREELGRLVDIFRLKHTYLGTHDIWVVDPNNYLWYGPYSTGKLAVYQAASMPLTDVEKNEGKYYGLIFCYQDSHDDSLSAAGAMIYPALLNPRTSLGLFLDHVMCALSESQAVVLAKQVSDGNVSIH